MCMCYIPQMHSENRPTQRSAFSAGFLTCILEPAERHSGTVRRSCCPGAAAAQRGGSAGRTSLPPFLPLLLLLYVLLLLLLLLPLLLVLVSQGRVVVVVVLGAAAAQLSYSHCLVVVKLETHRRPLLRSASAPTRAPVPPKREKKKINPRRRGESVTLASKPAYWTHVDPVPWQESDSDIGPSRPTRTHTYTRR